MKTLKLLWYKYLLYRNKRVYEIRGNIIGAMSRYVMSEVGIYNYSTSIEELYHRLKDYEEMLYKHPFTYNWRKFVDKETADAISKYIER